MINTSDKPTIARTIVSEVNRWMQRSSEPNKRGFLLIAWDNNDNTKTHSQWPCSVHPESGRLVDLLHDAFLAFPFWADAASKALEQISKEAKHE